MSKTTSGSRRDSASSTSPVRNASTCFLTISRSFCAIARGSIPPQDGAASENRQVPVELPLRHLDAVVLSRQLDGLPQRLRQLVDAQAPAVVGRHVVQVLLHRLGQRACLSWPAMK